METIKMAVKGIIGFSLSLIFAVVFWQLFYKLIEFLRIPELNKKIYNFFLRLYHSFIRREKIAK